MRVEVDGKPLSGRGERVYLMLNKPVGIVCTADPREKYNVVSYLNYPIRVFPVGRLDRESEGLLLLTSAGEIVNRLLRAEGGHEREYEVEVDRPVTRELVEKMQSGVPIPVSYTHLDVYKRQGWVCVYLAPTALAAGTAGPAYMT